MADIAPELLEKLQKSFQSSLDKNTKAASLLKKIGSGKAKYSDAGKYADEVGDALIKAFRDTLSSDVLPDGKMYWNIAERTIQPMYEQSYSLTSEAAKQVQQWLNQAAGIGLKAQIADLDKSIIRDIMDYICDADQYDDAADTLYKSAQAWNRTIVDQTLKKNAEFQARSGRSPRIIRTAEANCCSWCADLEGVYEYKGSYSVPENVYRRHEHCKCDVEYDPGTGSGIQNVHSKQWHDDQDRDKIEKRKKIHLPDNSFSAKEERKKISSKVNVDGDDVYRKAKSGGRHLGTYESATQKSKAQLQKSISSHVQQVETHDDKISNPKKYDTNWDNISEIERNGEIKKWRKDMERNAEEAEIEIKVWEERFG